MPLRRVIALVLGALVAVPDGARARALIQTDAARCPSVGSKSHGGCDDAVRSLSAPFDMWELARSWTPGFCGGTPGACSKRECRGDGATDALTLHGLWPSYVEATGSRKCYWPQNCVKPRWYPASEPWAFDKTILPRGKATERTAPAWTLDDLGSHEWAKHGTCAAWLDASGETRGMTQREFYNVTFALAETLGTPDALVRAAGSDLSLAEAQAAFGGETRVALGCTRKCVLVQAVQCFARAVDGGVGEPIDCPCVGVRDSRYDNSCAAQCERVRVLSPEQTGCDDELKLVVAAS